jgi:serine/threonine protein kinase/ribosomal protein S27E
MSEPNEKIEDLLAGFLDSLVKGESPAQLREKLIAENPELQPELEKRLTFAESILKTVGSRGRELVSEEPETQNEQIRRVDCPHCGNRLNLITRIQPEVTCANCGSVVTVENQLPATATAIEAPQQIGRFQVVAFLGSGGFGLAYRATDPQLVRTVAVKIPRAGQFIGNVERERFLREARNAAKLRHPNIVQVYEIGADKEIPFIVSEYIDGVTLSDRISGQRLAAKEIARIMSSVSEAVHFAHEQGVIHRDLKPSNIFLDLNNTPFVSDFGLARNLDAEYTMTLDGEILGTPAYMAPEQAAGQLSRVTARSDVYSLGVMLYRMLCCEHPFRGSARMMIHQVVHEEPRSPRSIDVKIPVDLETITLKAMHKNPESRYATAAEVAEDLRRWLADRPIVASPESRISKLRRWRRRHPRTALLLTTISLLLVLLSAVSVFWAVREKSLRFIAKESAASAQANAAESERRLAALFTQNGLHKLDRRRPW